MAAPQPSNYSDNSENDPEYIAICALYGADPASADPNFVRDFHAHYSIRPQDYDHPQCVFPFVIPAGEPGAGRNNIGFPPTPANPDGGGFMSHCIVPTRAAGRGATTMNGLATKGIGEWQYKRVARANVRRPGTLIDWDDKVTAYKCWFVNRAEFRLPQAETFTCSHFCHNDLCLNPTHFVVEPLPVNKGRNGCAGGVCCQHIVTCLRPGSRIYS